MSKYEAMFVTWNQEAKKEQDYLEEHVKGLLEKVGAKISRLAKWDERTLAYEIDGQREGIFYIGHFEAEGNTVVELRREAQLSEIVLRLLVLRLDGEFPTEEEIKKRSSRGERERGPRGMRRDDRDRPPRDRDGDRRDRDRDRDGDRSRDGDKPREEKSDAKPSDAKPAEAKPADAKPADAKPAEAKPSEPAAESSASAPTTESPEQAS